MRNCWEVVSSSITFWFEKFLKFNVYLKDCDKFFGLIGIVRKGRLKKGWNFKPISTQILNFFNIPFINFDFKNSFDFSVQSFDFQTIKRIKIKFTNQKNSASASIFKGFQRQSPQTFNQTIPINRIIQSASLFLARCF